MFPHRRRTLARRSLALIGLAATTALVAGACGSGSGTTSSADPTRDASHRRHQAAASTTSTSPEQEPAREPDPVAKPGAPCLKPADRAQLVRFGPHGILGGYVLGSGNRYVVLGHQSQGDSCQMLPLAQRFAAAGYQALAIDFSGIESSAKASYINRRLSDDLLAAVTFCRAQGAASVSLVGASMGGYGVLSAALAARPPVSAVISLSAPDAWDDPQGRTLNITGIRSPVQLWASRLDSGFAETARKFARQDPVAGLFIVPGGFHGVALEPVAFARMKTFLDAHTGAA